MLPAAAGGLRLRPVLNRANPGSMFRQGQSQDELVRRFRRPLATHSLSGYLSNVCNGSASWQNTQETKDVLNNGSQGIVLMLTVKIRLIPWLWRDRYTSTCTQ